METVVLKVDAVNPEREVISRAAVAIRRGELVAFPTETVYGLAADAFNPDAVARVFEVKGRPTSNPLPVQVAARDGVAAVAVEVPDAARRVMDAFWPGPLTIVLRARPDLPDVVTAGTGKVGVRMPDHPVALALIREVGGPIAAPSANVSGEPPPATAEGVLAHLEGKVVIVLDGGPAPLRVPSTVVDVTESPPRILRRGSIGAQMLVPYLGAEPGDAG